MHRGPPRSARARLARETPATVEGIGHERARISRPNSPSRPNSSPASPPSAPPISRRPSPTHAERIADLKALGRLIRENQAAIVAAINADYGNRSEFETLFGEVFLVARLHPRRRQAAEELDEAAPAQRRSPDLPRRAQPSSFRSRSASSASSCRGTFRFF